MVTADTVPAVFGLAFRDDWSAVASFEDIYLSTVEKNMIKYLKAQGTNLGLVNNENRLFV